MDTSVIQSVIDSLANWIAATSLSETLKAYLWIMPTSQSIHIIAASVVIVSALFIGLRLVGWSRSERTLSTMIGKQTRLIYACLIVLLVTGGVQTIGEPVRQFDSLAFWIKMPMVVFGLLLTYWLARIARSDPQRWDSADNRPASLRIYGATYVGTLTAIIILGRLISYS